MFTSITWSNYFDIVFVLLIIYYLVFGLKFYAQELKLMFSGNRKLPIHDTLTESDLEDEQPQNSSDQNIQSELSSSHKKFIPSEPEIDDTFEQVQELTGRLKEVIVEAISKNYIKEEFILSIHLLIRKYPFLKGSAFMVAINNLITSECEKQGYLLLDAEELVMLWNE